MGGYGLSSLFGADPGSPYVDPTQSSLGFPAMTPVSAAMLQNQQMQQNTQNDLSGSHLVTPPPAQKSPFDASKLFSDDTPYADPTKNPGTPSPADAPRAPSVYDGASVTTSPSTSTASSSPYANSLMRNLEGQGADAASKFIQRGGGSLDPKSANWCGAVVGSALRQAGYDVPVSNVATDYENVGSPVNPSQGVQPDDIVVFGRGHLPGETGGHVGLATGNTRTDANGNLEAEYTSGNTGGGSRADGKFQTTWAPVSGMTIRRPGSADPNNAINAPDLASVSGAQLDTNNSNWEIAHGNYAGLRVPGVQAGPHSGGFQSFSSPEAGLQAIAAQVQRYPSMFAGANTISSIMGHWAPSSDGNNTSQLIGTVAKAAGLDPNQQLNLHDPATLAKLTYGLSVGETGPNGIPGGLDTVNRALGVGKQSTINFGAPIRHGGSVNTFGGEHSGNNSVADTSVNTTGLPQTSNYRALAQTALVDPASLQNPQTSQMLQTLLQNPRVADMMSGNGNTSRNLALMASGFFGGRGPAQSLSGGFRGLAEGQTLDDKTRQGLLTGALGNQNELYKLGLTNNMEINKAMLANQGQMDIAKMRLAAEMPQKVGTIAASLVRGGTGLGTAQSMAESMLGQPQSQTQDQIDTLDKQTKKNQPLSPAIDKLNDTFGDQARNASSLGTQWGQVANDLQNGRFHLDKWSQSKYGVDNSGYPLTSPSDESSAYQRYKNLQAQATANFGGAFKGATTEKQLENAAEQVNGGGSMNTDQGGQIHAKALQGILSQTWRNAFSKTNENLRQANKDEMTADQFSAKYGADPLAGMSDADVQAQVGAGLGTGAPQVGGNNAAVGGGQGVGQAPLVSGGTMTFRTQ